MSGTLRWIPFSVKTALSFGIDLYDPTRIDRHGSSTRSPVASSRIILSVTCACAAAGEGAPEAAAEAGVEDGFEGAAAPSEVEVESVKTILLL